jgi:hypothetical protein
MKCLSCEKIRLLLILFMVVVMLSGSGAKADFTFSARENLGDVVNSPYGYGDYDPFIAPDGLSLYFCSNRHGGLGEDDIWVTTRATVSDSWGVPVNLGAPVNSEYRDCLPSITADGLILVFSSNMPGGLGGLDIWLTTRPTKDSPWDPPMNLGFPVNSGVADFCGCISSDGCSLYFSTGSSIGVDGFYYGGDIYMTTRSTTDSPWNPPMNLGLMPSRNGSGNWDPSISTDGLALFFDSDYVNVNRLPDIWMTTRSSNDSGWSVPILLGPEINTSDGEMRPSISADGSTLYWCCGGANDNTWDLWQSSISPTVDFNGDGNIDTDDLLIMIDNWSTSESLCDIGPMPWGDGVVDIDDLEIFIEYWEQENMSEDPEGDE